jgi:putative DNA-invertase from lambdoid prophage Rac
VKVAIYHRVSTLDQNPDAAREELRRGVAIRGWEVALSEEETGSGAKADRPGLLRVMEAVRRGKVGAVVVWKVDRFGRSLLDLLRNLEAINAAGARFVAVTQGLDIGQGGDPASRLLFTMLAAVSEFERELVRERTVLGMKRARDLGARFGRKPLPMEDQDAIRAGMVEGLNAYWIAKRAGLKQSTVRDYMKRFEQDATNRAEALDRVRLVRGKGPTKGSP